MAEFQKVMEAGNLPSAPATLNTNTGSLATDLTAAAGFGLQLLDRYNQGKAQSEAAQAQMQTKDALSRGEALAKRNAATLMQLEGTQLSLKRREFETQALNKLSGAELEGYLSGAEKFGMGSYLKDAIDSRRKQVDAELDYRRTTAEQGKEIVMSMAAGADPEAQKLYAGMLDNGMSEEEFFSIGQTEAGIRATAGRVSAVSAAEQAKLGLEKTKAEIEANAIVNEFILNKQGRLSVASNLVTQALASNNPTDVMAASNEFKRQVVAVRTEFTNLLNTLPPESSKYLDIQKQMKTLNDSTNQMITAIDNADPVKANDKMVSLALQGLFSGWLVQGTPRQQVTALSVFMKLPVDSQLAMIAIEDQLKGAGPNTNAFSEMANNLSSISSGAMKTTDPKFSSTLKLLQASLADTSDKVPALASISIQGAYEKLPAPADLKYVLKMREDVIKDPQHIQDFRQYIEEQGEDAWEVMRLENSKIIKDRIYPDLQRFGFDQGSVEFVVESGRVRAVFNTELPNVPVTDPTTGIVMSMPQRGQAESRRRLNEASRVIENLAKTSSAIGGIPEEDALKVMVATLNDNLLGTGANNAKK